MTDGSEPAGWYQDPTGGGDSRYWNGQSWTQTVDRAGTTVNVPIDPEQAHQPPVAGTQVQTPTPAPQTVVQQSPSRSPVGAIIGTIIVVLLIVVVIVVISNNNDSSDDTPTPGSGDVSVTAPADGGPAEEQPAEEQPSADGG
jgi:hypothetical protein